MAINRDLLNATLDVIRQSLQTDGGDVELIDVSDDGTVTLEMTGSCAAAQCLHTTCLRVLSAS